MGFSPAEVGAMTLWQFECCVAAHLAANRDPNKAPPPGTAARALFKKETW